MLTSTPYDMMVQLDDIGIDFSTINEYELFLLLFPTMAKMDTSLVFGDLDLTRFQAALDERNEMFFVDPETGQKIDRVVYGMIASTLRKIHFFERTNKKPGNDEAKKYMIERARVKQKRRARKKHDSQLEKTIVAVVNASEFKYGYEGVRNLTIYQFNASLHQIVRKVNFDNLMIGCYAGTINTKELSQDSLNWLT